LYMLMMVMYGESSLVLVATQANNAIWVIVHATPHVTRRGQLVNTK